MSQRARKLQQLLVFLQWKTTSGKCTHQEAEEVPLTAPQQNEKSGMRD